MKTEFDSMQEQRTYIRNLVNRKMKYVPKCIICHSDKNITIVHNFNHPYNISFICETCRHSKSKVELEALPKINLLDCIDTNSKYSHSKNLILDESIIAIINEALNTKLSLTEYLKTKNFSYHKFKTALNLYEKSQKGITNKIETHFKKLRADKIKNTLKDKKK